MPADVVGRIDAALAAEALLNATALDDATHVSRETTSAVGAPGAPAQKSPLTERTGHRRPAGRPEDSVGPGRKVHTRRRRGVLLGAFLSTAAVGIIVLLGSLLPSARNSTESSAASSRGSSQKSVASEFSEGRLRGRVDALLASGAASGPMVTPGPMVKGSGDSPSIEGSAPSPRVLRDAVPPCIRRGTGSPEAIIAFAQGTYEGSRAYLLVLPDTGDETQVRAYVVDATCVTGAPSVPGKVLLTRSYPRH
jgi:hypothetical protein